MLHIATQIQRYLAELPAALDRFTPDEMACRPAPGRWSKREILGHLCDSALHNWQRFNAVRRHEGIFPIERYPQDELVRQNNWQAQPTGQVAQLLICLNTQLVALLKLLAPDELARPIRLPDGSLSNLQFLAEDYLAHFEHHWHQVFPEKTASATLPAQWQFSVADARRALAASPEGKPFVTLLEQGKMYVELYQPDRVDGQSPHDQDEIYVVISGSGTFLNHGQHVTFQPGDLLFVPKGVEHRFVDFTEDFRTWVVFY